MKYIFFIGIVILSFIVILFIKNNERKCENFDLYKEVSFFKKETKVKIDKLDLKQKCELKNIFDRYDLLSEGEKKDTYPFIGPIAVFRVEIDGKPFLLFMSNNSKHLFKKNKLKKLKKEFNKKLFWLNKVDEQGTAVEDLNNLEVRVFESPRLYSELEHFLEKYAIPVKQKQDQK